MPTINALAESTVGSFKTELIGQQGPWRDIDQIELETLNWVHWFNTERPHAYLDDLTPETAEHLHYDHQNSTDTRRMTQNNECPDTPGGLNAGFRSSVDRTVGHGRSPCDRV